MKRSLSIPLVLVTALLFQVTTTPGSAGNKPPLKAGVSATHELDDFGIEVKGDTLPAKIQTIRLGTPAALTGLRAGDEVQSFARKRTRLTVTVKRGGKIYQSELVPLQVEDESQYSEGFYTAPKAEPNVKVKPLSKEGGFLVRADIAFCTADDNPNWDWLEAEQKDPQLKKEWQDWLSRVQSLIFNAVVAGTKLSPNEPTEETRNDYHLAIRCDTPNAVPKVEVRTHPNLPLVQQREAAMVNLIPLLQQMSPYYGQFPPKTKAKLVHLSVMVIKPTPKK